MSKQLAPSPTGHSTKRCFKPKKPRAHFRPPSALFVVALCQRYRNKAQMMCYGAG